MKHRPLSLTSPRFGHVVLCYWSIITYFRQFHLCGRYLPDSCQYTCLSDNENTIARHDLEGDRTAEKTIPLKISRWDRKKPDHQESISDDCRHISSPKTLCITFPLLCFGMEQRGYQVNTKIDN